MRESTGRAIRIEALKQRIEVLANVQDDVPEPKLVAEFALAQNVSERKVKEYLNLLLNSGWCKRTSHGILPKEHADLQNAIDPGTVSAEEEADSLLNNHITKKKNQKGVK